MALANFAALVVAAAILARTATTITASAALATAVRILPRSVAAAGAAVATATAATAAASTVAARGAAGLCCRLHYQRGCGSRGRDAVAAAGGWRGGHGGVRVDTPVRFDTDRFEVAIEAFRAGAPVSLPVIEILS